MKTPKSKEYVISLSFGNYLKKDGGTDKVMMEHQKILNHDHISYVQIAPVGKNAEFEMFAMYTLVIDGEFCGIIDEYEMAKFFSGLNKMGCQCKTIFIHHLKKFRLAFIQKLLYSTSVPIILYVHDYYSICRQEQLLKDGKNYCGDEAPSKSKCQGCIYQKEGVKYRNTIKEILIPLKSRLTIVAPSNHARNIFSNAFEELSKCTLVVPHQRFEGEYHNKDWSFEKINIAYIGKLIPAKGSCEWNSLLDCVSNRELKYKCTYFGLSDDKLQNCSRIEVSVDQKHLDAMVVALRKNNIQIVVMWAIWPETYSYTYYEALAANCFVLTNNISGNIYDEVLKRNNGKVFNTYEELEEYICDWEKVRSDLIDYWERTNIEKVPHYLLPNDIGILSLVGATKSTVEFEAKFNLSSYIKSLVYGVLYKIKNRRS